MNKKNNNIIETILSEAFAYSSLEVLESYLVDGKDLSALPMQPLFLALKSLPPQKTSLSLTKLSKEQKQSFLSIDLWSKDTVDVESFRYWVTAYANCEDEQTRLEFARTSDFLLYLKSKFNVWTFDVEDPTYPDHDHYFLTDDSLLLFEYDENYEQIEEIQELIRLLYSYEGVENAYAMLFKMTSDSFLSFEEEEYQEKKSRLRDVGFVDYYDALELVNCFPSLSHVDHFIRTKEGVSGHIDKQAQNQSLHQNSLVAYKDHMDVFSVELQKVQSELRKQFLQFNFLRLVNGTMTVDDALKRGTIAMTKVGAKTRNHMFLGFDYIQSFITKGELTIAEGQSLFDLFEFSDLYKIGNSLISLKQKELKKALRINELEGEAERFIGQYFSEFLETTFESPIRYQSRLTQEKEEILKVDVFKSWVDELETLVQLAPYIKKFLDVYNELKATDKIQDDYYINYSVSEIDFETLLLGSFAHSLLGTFSDSNSHKLGLTIDEYKKFASFIVNNEGEIKSDDEFMTKVDLFLNSFGLDKVDNIKLFFIGIISDQMSGYQFQNLEKDEFKHVGGPVILFT
jgi:hypothetical protein